MNDTKLRCVLVYRLSEDGATTVAKHDHANQYESHRGAAGLEESTLYGNRDEPCEEQVKQVILNDPPNGLTASCIIGGFKVVRSGQHQVVYGADENGVCTYAALGTFC